MFGTSLRKNLTELLPKSSLGLFRTVSQKRWTVSFVNVEGL